ncbi:MAG: tetraacyldisaccharide 4'-kinase [Bacteroidetes bacterium GWF2_43_63]|nr:MAG: tetraacyldisaccharide 4'-kinase [Bacteroidetes bacterium GWE2_42_42]OFY53535.1 MAG: tetraacyldisaccharide 4'-kinase [Bacteroidetes bacterium GWF2_43_63]HBG71135.1 tetraacyldisaccharide 4'-kinase [Bacteroidales bacterium]HCB63712.1 tetraacyldisaccharide 4'-kinase [Bacteroidales bacterium]HCY24461.1 tetraacyldisaccharide 4'-kinase [Bacteroidales bacterium]
MGFRFLLFPFQWGYILIVSVRKLLYAIGIKKRWGFDVPVICIGNLNAGGSGKTPHTKYVANLLVEKGYNVSIIMRGYKRNTSGFIHCNKNHNVAEIGDEAYEYVRGLDENINVFVCERRRKGIREILKKVPSTDVILMDDGYQHLDVKAGLYILLTDYLNPYWKDHVLPVGKLRECKSAKKRADVIIVSKTPKVFSPIIGRDLIEKIKPGHHQNIAFSYLDYGKPVRVYSDSPVKLEIPDNTYSIFLLCGIANPYPLEEYLKRSCVELYAHKYPDHYSFKLRDIEKLADDFKSHMMKSKVIFTTEKDVARLMLPEIKEKLVDLPFFYIPVTVGIHESKEFNLDKLIIDYVGKNCKNS